MSQPHRCGVVLGAGFDKGDVTDWRVGDECSPRDDLSGWCEPGARVFDSLDWVPVERVKAARFARGGRASCGRSLRSRPRPAAPGSYPTATDAGTSNGMSLSDERRPPAFSTTAGEGVPVSLHVTLAVAVPAVPAVTSVAMTAMVAAVASASAACRTSPRGLPSNTAVAVASDPPSVAHEGEDRLRSLPRRHNIVRCGIRCMDELVLRAFGGRH